MSESNKDTIRRMFDEVVNHGKLDLIEDLFHPDFRTITAEGEFDRDGFRAYVEGWRAAFPDVHCQVEDLIAEGDMVAWAVRATGTQTGDFLGVPATGRSVDFYSLNIGQMRDGRAYRHRVIMDGATLMAQLGLPAS